MPRSDEDEEQRKVRVHGEQEEERELPVWAPCECFTRVTDGVSADGDGDDVRGGVRAHVRGGVRPR